MYEQLFDANNLTKKEERKEKTHEDKTISRLMCSSHEKYSEFCSIAG